MGFWRVNECSCSCYDVVQYRGRPNAVCVMSIWGRLWQVQHHPRVVGDWLAVLKTLSVGEPFAPSLCKENSLHLILGGGQLAGLHVR